MNIKGVLWHSTGCNNPRLKRYVQPDDDASDREEWLKKLGVNKYHNDWNHIHRRAGLNCWIGKLEDGTVTTVQTMPWNYKPWGCGSGKKGSCNSGWIQFEICEDDLTDKKYFEEVYKEACEITAYLCKMYNIDPKGTVVHNGVVVPTILCHQDSYKLGLGNNHGDVYNWFKKFGKTMDDVRKDVAELIKDSDESSAVPSAKGDVNGDGEVNKKDLLALEKHIADDAYPVENGDVNGDGAVNKKDVLELKKILAGSKTFYRVQVGSFKNNNNAEALKSKINGASICFEGDYYKVVVEPFYSIEEANKTKAALEAKGYKPVVVKIGA
jgi:hypothetical protein